MSRALYFGLPLEGHVNPSLGLVQELVRYGEEIIYYSGDEYKEKILKSGAEFRSLGFIKSKQDKRDISSHLNPLERENRLLHYIIKVMPTILNQVKEDNVDYIIFDTQFVLGKMIAHQLSLPSVSFCTTFAFSKKKVDQKRKRLTNYKLNSALVEEQNRLRQNLSNEYGFAMPDSIMFTTGDITLVCTSKYFQPESGDFDKTFKFIGPSITDRNDTSDFPIAALKGSRTIFISMGTIVNEQPELYSSCLKAFADMDILVVMSIGKKVNIQYFGNIPSNFIIRNYVPQLQVLQNTDVFITHCGMNSTSEALYYGVPLVMNPIGSDQPMVAERVNMLGAGIILDKSEINVEGLRKAVETILSDPGFVKNASKIGESLRSTGGYRKGVEEIISFKKSKGGC
ncbi:macrolide family glycosyltransferase [Neobacillus cucumis]|uniref:macrolide family glycosyltransferase n=1 Tax=Neobacillus cucumis TaxID=1740721 RepID=UPI00285348E0|nr:macrolide family glycosyltransferase [Neobacillus cucumis]MDR4947919.1 glycosyltransferase [Neobacillus cucumis]